MPNKFVHRGSLKQNGDKYLSIYSLLQSIIKYRKEAYFIFHGQSSLPYLFLAWVFIRGLNMSAIKLTYDVHDLHEKPKKEDGNVRSLIRFYIFYYIEKYIFSRNRIKKITVSVGLANEMQKIYGSSKPTIVYNVSGMMRPSNTCVKLNNSLLYFGTAGRFPFLLLDAIQASGIDLHVYGRGMNSEWMISEGYAKYVDNVTFFGAYSPDDLSFIHRYKCLVIYAPNDISLNFKYSMPNKLFQALGSGLSVVVSSNFSEMIETFSAIRGAVISIDPESVQNDMRRLTSGMNRESIEQSLAFVESLKLSSIENYKFALGLDK
ncbi:MAG: hypothetical protein U1D25_19955 [Hydrogenophaga sp.]|uniref:hypothetical protein n=1 Tax=Hydrogenophaga sp. TaxID=1904254 RepID=UPI002AB8CEA6|nr:hypothetical protein [Hydrogenophaga sp.]MDZ4190366.1 hypothetical protein [Hydrogenophaga sp.]